MAEPYSDEGLTAWVDQLLTMERANMVRDWLRHIQTERDGLKDAVTSLKAERDALLHLLESKRCQS